MLDNPVYHALTGPHAALAVRAGRALRYPAAVAPFGALPADPDDADWAALATLAAPDVALIAPGEIPPGWAVTGAIGLYEAMGFTRRRTAAVIGLEPRA